MWRRSRGLALVALTTACAADVPSVSARYDPATLRLVEIVSDLNRDGRPDHWAYMNGTRVQRAEIDGDGDGRVDRWEYYLPDGSLQRVGTSSAGDGVADSWAWAEDATGERRVDVASSRDGVVDRREFYRGDALVRVEQDADRDGRVETWQIFEEGRLREVRIDTSGRGTADRRLVYDRDGRFVGVWVDADGDGAFDPVPADAGTASVKVR